MEMTMEDVAAASGGNAYFAAVSLSLLDDFRGEERPLYGQRASASWRRELDLYSKERRIVLSIACRRGDGEIRVYPVTRGDGSFGLGACCRSGEVWKDVEFLASRMPEFYAVEALRLACAAMLGDKEADER